MTTSPWRSRAAAVLLVVGLSITGGVATAHAGDDDGPLRDRLHLACQRIPNIQHRVETAIAHLTAGAEVRGSIAWVEEKIAQAEANNRPRVVEDLTARLAIMQDRLAVIQNRQTRLAGLAERCAALGDPA